PCPSSLYSPPPHRALHSFPTRRSSDLDGDPVLGRALAGAHPGLGGLLGDGLVREDVDPDLAATADLARHRDSGSWREFVERRLRSEEHTSELQSRRDLVCRLLLEKKKK